jgi:hypothetical protein
MNTRIMVAASLAALAAAISAAGASAQADGCIHYVGHPGEPSGVWCPPPTPSPGPGENS